MARLVLGSAVLAACLCVALPAGARIQTKTKLVSVNSHENQGDGSSQYGVALSSNGRYVAFQSESQLTGGDNDSFSDVFLRDRKRGATTLVSPQQNSSHPNGGSGECGLDMTPDARFVAFGSFSERLVKHDSNGFGDVFVRDRKREKTTLVSVSSSGKKGDADSCYDVAISGGGRYVAFSSDSTKFTHGDGNGSADVFVRDLKKGTTTLVSKAQGGGPGNGYSGDYGLEMSANGRFVAFESVANDLVGSDGNGWGADVFVRDLKKHKTKMVSVSTGGLQGGFAEDSLGTAMSPNGRYVVFNSEVGDLAPGDGDGVIDVFIRDRKEGTTKLVSLANDGANGDDNSGYQGGFGYDTMAVSNDGRFVAFDSYAENLVGGNDGNGWIDLFLRDMNQDKTKLLSAIPAGNSGNDESAYYSAAMTPDARWVAFNSGAEDLVGSDTNGSTYDIFIRGPLR